MKIFEMKIEDCIECPAHHCDFKYTDKQKCRCEITNRMIPEKITVQMTFPSWCPLEDVKEKKAGWCEL